MLRRLLKPDPSKKIAQRLFASIAERARARAFYERHGVPDTIDGRFDLLALHVFLALETLRKAGPAGAALATHLTTATFQSLEDGLRDLGVGDMGLSRRMKAMADAFYGRLEAYRAAQGSKADLAAALLRNVYRGEADRAEASRWMAGYALAALKHLESAPAGATLMEDVADFGPAPE